MTAAENWKFVLMGTGPFAVPSFEAIAAAGNEIALVVTRPEIAGKSRKGPPPAPVRTWATDRGYAIFDPTSINDGEAVQRVRSVAADLLVVCDYGQILKPDALECGRLGGINLHGSLLPKYRGAAPVQRALLAGDGRTGVSVIHMTPRLDGGPILATRETPIDDHETAGELEHRLSHLGVDATLEAIDRLRTWDGAASLGDIQNPEAVTKAPRLHKSEAAIDWARTAREIDCHVRGMQPWPVAFTHYAGDGSASQAPIRLAVLEIESSDRAVGPAPAGTIDGSDGELWVASTDYWVRLSQVKPAGKRAMPGADFLRGNPAGPEAKCTNIRS